jgi:hypothetical protein
MPWWFLKRGNKFEDSVKSSFTNIKEDMSQVTTWISHFKGKHETHDSSFSEVLERLESIEQRLKVFEGNITAPKAPKEKVPDKIDTTSSILDKWDELTPMQKSLCIKIYHLQKEKPKSWISLKEVASELYPHKEYSKVRTTISDYVSLLEAFGFVKRKRKGRQAYIKLNGKKLSSLDQADLNIYMQKKDSVLLNK